ncbi:PadR family transcriptional regulator [Nocardia cyriacigeorgica]|uniref:Transcriptional regulator, Acidobacterial, PadR-family n=1 Tax=Nocardia cyriacigeorgica TaxID=135487 RepID=A0A4U8W0A5_9NOCA|nr:PadR family transcriptional regulator [Nocardia cyriacigeorgica]MBF6160967.1 PadR family transcriptional regulator [Nocardia cyriacigeorgica]MBF6201042.1 PadR family transcriptional regulator [Nocardia cyriacigeorgica]MBF6318701.1 PadR family transcriptional regulator [Nocardia cyriacigeorgica]MBF6531788.1 PadR family transcriptional regulator [Nocardia cyriacigeorgica]VFA99410.1 transcriptional regulator, Acidobacterial, PadR-family [Nocardia cyriacigeorgica]
MGQRTGAAVTPLAIAVLALLEERPMHPYEMYQLLTLRREGRLVKVRPGSLYHVVTRLAELELVRAEGIDRAGNRPERTTYRITPDGRETLRNRITELLRKPLPEYPLFPVALGEAHNLPKAEVLALLRERVDHLAGELAELETMIGKAERKQVPRRYWIVLPYLCATVRTEIEWVERLVDELDSGALAWEEFDPVTGERAEPCDAPPWRPPSEDDDVEPAAS